MPVATGAIYTQADLFKAALAKREQVASAQLLLAWSDSYWETRKELDRFLAKVAQARLSGAPVSPAWAYQERRLAKVLDTTRREIARYADTAAGVTTITQRASVQAAMKDAVALTQTAVKESLPGLAATFVSVNPANVTTMAGFLADGSTLATHLARTLPEETADAVQRALLHGLATGKGQDWMVRQATRGLGLAHGRAVTIMRTESLRAYRETTRETFKANRDTVGGWTWNAALDNRCCMACVIMHGTEHPVDAHLDGHPRCRCAMVPRTLTWEQILGDDGKDVPDTRPPVEQGQDWFRAQSPLTQKAMLGRSRYDAWKAGEFDLPDLVARQENGPWGTMRTERSLKAIREGRNANWMDRADDAAPAPQTPPQAPVDPFAGLTDNDLRKRMSQGDYAERRAAQTELVRRSDAKAAAAKAERQAILERHAGDGKTWTKVEGLPDAGDAYQRGRYTVVTQVDLEDLEGFLDDVARTVDAIPPDLARPVTFRVPAADRTFRSNGSSLTGGYVTQGFDVVNVNPVIANGFDPPASAKRGHHMAAAEDVEYRRWVLAHELGHIIDFAHDHTLDGRKAGGLWRKQKAGLGGYGKSSRVEGYAEAWAQWLVGGPGSNPVADAYAKEYGWKRN